MIDYGKIAKAIKHYTELGYEYIEVPWLVSQETMNVTAPSDRRLFDTFAGSLVASGEQSFIEIRKTLKRGKYLCATPCFRDEQSIDELHRQYFFKVELINVGPRHQGAAAMQLLFDAWKLFHNYWPVDTVKTDIGWDLNIGEVEVGSYGYREHDGFAWAYGTGIAEPRLSQAVVKAREKWNESVRKSRQP